MFVIFPHLSEGTNVTEIIKQIILWKYKVLWADRKVVNIWEILKPGPKSNVKLQDKVVLILISQDRKFRNVIRHLEEIGFLTIAICPENSAGQLTKETELHVNWDFLSDQEHDVADIVVVENPKVS